MSRNTPARRVAVVGVAAAAVTVTLTVGTVNAFGGEAGEIRGADRAGAVSDRYIAIFEPETVSAAEVATTAHSLASAHKGEIQYRYDSTVRGFSVIMDENDASALAAEPEIDYVEQVTMASASGEQTNPPSWGLDRSDQAELPLDDSFAYPDHGGEGAAVYVIDSGVRMTHNDFGGRVSSGYDFIDEDDDASDCHGHGTHVAGTVGGQEHGVAKAAPMTSVRVLDCEGSGPWDAIIAGLDWAVDDAAGESAVANMSLGGGNNDSMDAAVEAATEAGVLVAVAGMNEASDACEMSPGSAPSAVTVAASTDQDAQASFSNFGECVDLYGPGENIISATQDGDDTSGAMSGTSMATPHVAGAAALYMTTNGGATVEETTQAVVDNASADVITNPGSGTANLLLDVSFLNT